MDLPFAVDSGHSQPLDQSATSLMTASSQGSFIQDHEDDIYAQAATAYIGDAPLRFDDAYIQGQPIIEPDMEVIDFTQYVTVTENDATEVEVLIDPGEAIDLPEQGEGDVLALLMSGDAQNGELVVSQCEEANKAAHQAVEEKKKGNLGDALHYHTIAAKVFHDAAVAARDTDVIMSNSLLVLSQSQAKSALALKEFFALQGNSAVISSSLTQKERLRATVRGALLTKKEADISDSMFLGKAKKEPQEGRDKGASHQSDSDDQAILTDHSSMKSRMDQNPVDEMLELERELKEMDSALELGNSIASLGSRTQNRLKQSTMDGSFMVVPPGSSYISSSAMWSRPPRAKANRVGAPTTSVPAVAQPQPPRPVSQTSLDASWWGNGSTASQVLAGSVVSIASSKQESTNTKQLMRLLDAIKTLSDENAALLREVEEAESARQEAKASKEQMRRFKLEYSKRFDALKNALEKFRTDHPHASENIENPVRGSDYVQSMAVRANEQLARQEQLIRKLTADLKKEKEEGKRKDAALKKYENFYREVKARSAEKAKQREEQQRRRGGQLLS